MLKQLFRHQNKEKTKQKKTLTMETKFNCREIKIVSFLIIAVQLRFLLGFPLSD